MDDHGKAMTIVERAAEHHAVSPVVATGMKMLEQHPSPETLQKLLDMQREYEANEARKAYTAALVALKADLPKVIDRDKLVEFESSTGGKPTSYRHATLANVMNQVREPLAEHGFAITWHPSTGSNGVTVRCRLTHRAGHFEEVEISAPPDSKGGKNSVQAVGSTITYLERYTALSLLGIATADMDDADDNDGEPKQPDASKVDTNRNLRAVGLLKKRGRTVEQAVAFLDGRTVEQWTEADLKKLEAWAKAPAQTEGAA